MRRGLGWAGWLRVAGCRAAGLRWAGWAELCLGGLLDGQGLFHTHLGLEASRRHVRHARAEGLGLRLVSGWHTLSQF